MPDQSKVLGTKPEELVALAKKAAEYLFRTSFKRVLSTMIAFGVALLGLSWVDVIAFLVQAVGQGEQASTLVTVAQLTGIGMIGIGFVGHLWLYLGEKQAERQAAKTELRGKAADLVGRLRVLINGFRDEGVSRDAGYYNQEIIQCHDLAVEFMRVAPPEFKADHVLAAIAAPKFDASKQKPLFDIEIADIEALTRRIAAHYEIGQH